MFVVFKYRYNVDRKKYYFNLSMYNGYIYMDSVIDYIHTVFPPKLVTLYNSVIYITQYLVHILEFCRREINDFIV